MNTYIIQIVADSAELLLDDIVIEALPNSPTVNSTVALLRHLYDVANSMKEPEDTISLDLNVDLL